MGINAPIRSLEEFVTVAVNEAEAWKPVFPWFRGELADTATPLLPSVFRDKYDENNLLQSFRRRAHLLNLPVIPPVDAIDQWLFLARHVGLPTRLLDWTEGALIALFFALSDAQEKRTQQTVLWMLNPHMLNMKSSDDSVPNAFPLTWHDPRAKKYYKGPVNIGFENIGAAWEQETRGLPLPVAVEPTTIHPRMNAQHSYFTVHGTRHESLNKIVDKDCLRRYEIDIPPADGIAQLRTMGIADSTISPDADSLAKELSRFMRRS